MTQEGDKAQRGICPLVTRQDVASISLSPPASEAVTQGNRMTTPMRIFQVTALNEKTTTDQFHLS